MVEVIVIAVSYVIGLCLGWRSGLKQGFKQGWDGHIWSIKNRSRSAVLQEAWSAFDGEFKQSVKKIKLKGGKKNGNKRSSNRKNLRK